MSLIKRLSTLPEVVRRHLAGEAPEAAASPIHVERIEILVPDARVGQFGYGDPDDDAPGVH